MTDHADNLRDLADGVAHLIGRRDAERLRETAYAFDAQAATIATLTAERDEARGDAARFERDLTALHGDYDALEVERDGLRAEVVRLTEAMRKTHAILVALEAMEHNP